jgi:DNA gyrase/topoisomerase IV subunit A
MAKKDLTKPKTKVIKLPVSKFIDTKYRDYAIYVLISRGIPSFYDALTPVQRYILKNTSTTFNKSLTIVGKCIQDGYHHGDTSLTGALNKLARPFGNALQILEGGGFFGNEVSPNPAAARYTSVKLNAKTNSILNTYRYLTTREEEGPYDPFWMDIPLGLTSPIVGIAVGYKTTMLPRKLEHIKEFLDNKRKNVKPYLENFTGTISKYKGMSNSWLLTSVISVEKKKIQINDIPPILKYSSILKKLDQIILKFEGKIRIINNSNIKVNIGIIYTGKNSKQWELLQKYVKKVFSVVVNENPVFIKDGQVLVYDNVEQYLTDYKWQILRLNYTNTKWQKEKLKFDLEFNEIKKLFIEFILTKRRTNIEINKFLKAYNKKLRTKLEGLTARKFTKDELISTKAIIKELTKELKGKLKELNKIKKVFETTLDPTLERGISSKKISVDLFDTDDVEETDDGIIIWDGDDIYDDEEKIIIESE